MGFDSALKDRAEPIVGIANGIDVDVWNPATDPHIVAPYSKPTSKAKVPNKVAGSDELPMCTASVRNEKNRRIGLTAFGDGVLLLSGPSGDEIKFGTKPKVNVNGWNRGELSVNGTTVNLRVNGEQVVKDHAIPNIGNFDAGGGPVWLSADQAAEFRSVFVRELKEKK